jgi:hypothetical protein
MVVGKLYRLCLFSALTVLGSEVILLQVLNPVCGLSYEILKTNEPGQCRVIGAEVELFSVEILMECSSVLAIANSSCRLTQ